MLHRLPTLPGLPLLGFHPKRSPLMNQPAGTEVHLFILLKSRPGCGSLHLLLKSRPGCRSSTSAADYDLCLLKSRSGCCSLVEPPCIRCGAPTLPGLPLVGFHPRMNFYFLCRPAKSVDPFDTDTSSSSMLTDLPDEQVPA